MTTITLTKNRIIEKGDEYLDKSGAWKPVPKDEIGLQIMFSKLKEVRRQEKTKPSGNGSATKPAAERPTIKVGTAQDNQFGTTKVVDPTDSRGTPEHPVVITKLADFDPAAHGLPTVVSKKAHKLGETADPTKAPFSKAEWERHATTFIPYAEIKFPAGSPKTIWTGRNGTFNSLGVELQRGAGTNICAIVPQGKRGTAKNAIIEFPVSAIPQMIDFLQRQLP